MSTLGKCDLVTLPIEDPERKQVEGNEYLRNVSPCDKPWDQHRGEADDVAEIFAESLSERHCRYAERIAGCAQVLGFVRDSVPGKLTLKNVWFCRVRTCPVCQWRRAVMWQARVYYALPLLMRDYPDIVFLFLTLTVKNCPITALRSTLLQMAHGWKRMMEVKTFPAIGWVRSVEVTRSKHDRSAHPHYHCLLMVTPEYFKSDYLHKDDWVKLWQQSLRIDYKPIVHIKRVLPEIRLGIGQVIPAPWNMWGAVTEILKYAVKPSDMVRDPWWFLQLVDQIHKTRAVAVGGVLKRYLREHEKENLTIEPGDERIIEEVERLFFQWKQIVRRYRRMGQ